MAKKNLIFSGLFCYIDDVPINSLIFRETVKEGTHAEVDGDRIIHFEVKYEDEFLKINFSDGSAMPRNPNVFNKSKQKFEPNPRDSDQIEPKEYFAVLDLSKSYLWLSNTKKKSILLNYFQSHFKKKKVLFKDVYEEKEFINGLKSIDQIKLSAVPDLFSRTNTLTKALVDEMYGAHEATLHLKYKNKNIEGRLFDRIKNIFLNKKNFKRIMISGRDSRNMGMFFNNNIFTRKIEIDAIVDENEMFDPQDIFEGLIVKIQREERKNV
jgi:hypothetical protein